LLTTLTKACWSAVAPDGVPDTVVVFDVAVEDDDADGAAGWLLEHADRDRTAMKAAAAVTR
jgi:hypothetical protein